MADMKKTRSDWWWSSRLGHTSPSEKVIVGVGVLGFAIVTAIVSPVVIFFGLIAAMLSKNILKGIVVAILGSGRSKTN